MSTEKKEGFFSNVEDIGTMVITDEDKIQESLKEVMGDGMTIITKRKQNPLEDLFNNNLSYWVCKFYQTAEA